MVILSFFFGVAIGVMIAILLIVVPELQEMGQMAIERGAAEMVCEGTSCKFTWKVVE